MPWVNKKSAVICISCVAVASLFASSTQAQASTSSFTGNIASACTLTLGTNGALGINAAGTSLGSKEAGGLAANAAMLATAATYQLQVDPVTSFAVAPAGGQPDAVTDNYSTTGVTSITAA